MNNTSNANPSGKVMFGVDYLHLMRDMEIPRENEKNNEEKIIVVDAVIKLFLLQWDFSIDEIDQANKVYWDKIHSGTLDQDLNPVINRVVDFLKNDKKAQEKLIIEMTAVAQMDEYILEDEKALPQYLVKRFDFRPSEFESFIQKGWDWQVALNFLGTKFIEFHEDSKK